MVHSVYMVYRTKLKTVRKEMIGKEISFEAVIVQFL